MAPFESFEPRLLFSDTSRCIFEAFESDMAELALGVLGVVPLGLLVFKAHKSAKQKLKSFREYDDEAARLQKAFDIQRQFFKNEWKILLKLVIQDRSVLSSMNGDYSHEKWSDAELDQQLRKVLDQNYEACLGIIEAIYTASRELELELARISSLGEEGEERGQEKKTIRKLRRVQDGLRVLRHSKGFAKSIEELKNALSQLIALRGQLEKLTEPERRDEPQLPAQSLTRSAATSEYLRTWSQCLQMRKASATLHAALTEVWNCSHEDHSKHLFKLFVETGKIQDEIQMRLAIIYDCRTQLEIQSSRAHLEVRSKNVTWVEHPDSRGSCAGESPHTKRLKVVRFEETTISASVSQSTRQDPGLQDETSWTSSDLRSSQDICSELTRAASPSQSFSSVASHPDTACLGHIEVLSEPRFRHTFYSGFDQALCSHPASDPSTLGDMIKDIRRDLVDAVDKLKLARSVAMAVLKFHSTPWLGQVWQLQDMAMFVDDVEDISKSLETLHVNVEFAKTCPDMMEGVRGLQTDCQGGHDTRTDEEIMYNIKNRPLYSLGVAFLQIDRWVRFDLGDVVTVRKTAELPSSISKKFRDLTQRCLECNFGRGPGTNLSKPALQKAVCRSVVGELDNLISLAEEMNLVEPTDDEDW